jgi:hypothetical protein
MVGDVDGLLKAQNFGVANIGAINERTEEQ